MPIQVWSRVYSTGGETLWNDVKKRVGEKRVRLGWIEMNCGTLSSSNNFARLLKHDPIYIIRKLLTCDLRLITICKC